MTHIRSIRAALFAALLATPFAIGLVAPGSALSGIPAASAAEEKERETRKTPALREASYKKLSEAQELIDLKDYQGALAVLVDMSESRGMNPYETASMQNMNAFIYFSMEDYPGAIRSYEAVLAQRPEIPLALEQSTLYALGQLYFVQEQYQKAIDYLEQWFEVADNPGPQPFIFMAQAYYQMQDYARVPSVVQQAMDVAVSREQDIQENWWLLSRAAYYELENWDKVIEILEILVRDYPKKDYWIQLSGLYGQEGMQKKQVATIWVAYVQGYLEAEREYMNVAGLMLQEEVPYYAARILDEGMDKGIVEDTAKNLQMLAQAWQLAQEVDKAIPVYQKAAAKSDEGELYFRLAQLYLDKDDCEDAIEASSKALDKGKLKNEAQVHLVKGMCEFNLKKYNDALASFSKGQVIARREESELDLKSLNNWRRYVENEKSRDEELRRSSAQL
ncbi:MAG TPA: tetratricopeptide repeat protein [Pseudomonadales bacterium]|nr:tetratricopeptide repeat protein [Pseudomonadales bacterium]